jgi:hypothetical protein
MSYSDEPGDAQSSEQDAVAPSSELRNRGMFQAGVSGNPGGRPKRMLEDGRSLADVARGHTEDAVAVLVEVMGDAGAPAASRVSAAAHILDRGWGRPNQGISVEAPAKNTGRELSAHEAALRVQSLINLAISRRDQSQKTGIPWSPDKPD